MCLLFFPRLALGLSGFETGVAVMPLVRGNDADDPAKPAGRIRNTRKLLLTAAIIMSIMLMGSSIVTTMLIPAEELHAGGRAANRALAFLAHGQGPNTLGPIFGNLFGTAYDISTVAILWFAGASALSGLLNLVPRYLPRYGMAPEWATATRPLVLLLTAVSLLVTLIFRADVNAQGGAYATGVMVLILSASAAVVIDRYRAAEGPAWRRIPWRYVLITAVFLYTALDIIITKPDGVTIAACFIAAVLVFSAGFPHPAQHRAALHGVRVRQSGIEVPLGVAAAPGDPGARAAPPRRPDPRRQGGRNPRLAPPQPQHPHRVSRGRSRRRQRVLPVAADGNRPGGRAVHHSRDPLCVHRPCHRGDRPHARPGRASARTALRLVR
jgi:hypothetical protein